MHTLECFYIRCQAPVHASKEKLQERIAIMEGFEDQLRRDVAAAKHYMPDTKDSKDPLEPHGSLWRAACLRAGWQFAYHALDYYNYIRSLAETPDMMAVLDRFIEIAVENKRKFLGSDF